MIFIYKFDGSQLGFEMDIFIKVLIYAACAVGTFLLLFGLYKLIRFLRSKNIHIPNTVKRILKLFLLLAVLAVVGYFVFTGYQI